MTLGVKAFVWQLGVWGISALLLFLPAGTLIWSDGWAFFLIFFGFVLALSIFLLRYDPDLLKERLTVLKTEQQGWDKAWLLIFYVLSLLWLALMPLDAVRLRWSHVPPWLQVLGALSLLCSQALIFLTIRANTFLSPVARIQRERDHAVISTGPYRYVRHPLYSAASLFYLSVPLLLGSWGGLLLAPVFLALLVLRAVLEERMLLNDLPGYDAYMRKVKYRFIPLFC